MFCTYCGTSIESQMQFCPSCGRSTGLGAEAQPGQAVQFTAPQGVRARTGHWIGQGWELVKSDLGFFFVLGLLFTFISGAVPLILKGAMAAGLQIVCMKKLLGRRADIGDLFQGFNYFVPTLAATLVMGVFAAIGLVLCIIPGLVVIAMYEFTYLLIVDKKLDFWPAMQASHAIVKQDYFGFTMFLIAMGLVNLLGLLCCLVGVFVTVPLGYAAVTVAYKEIVGFEPNSVA